MWEVVYINKWKNVRVRQELIEEAKKEINKSAYKSLSEFVSESIHLRLQTLAKERISEYLVRDLESRIPRAPAQLAYTPKHIWAQLTHQGNVKLGVTDYFLKEILGITYIETLQVGENVSKDESFGIAETPKWWYSYDLISPLNGKIISVNKKIVDNPIVLNEDPYEWILAVKPEKDKVDTLMNELLSLEDYQLLNKLKGGRKNEDSLQGS